MPRRIFWASRDSHPLDHRYAARYHETPQSLPFIDRFFSWTAGWRDVGVLGIEANESFVATPANEDGEASLPTTRWLTRNLNSCLEAIEREYLDGESRTARLAHDLDRVYRNILRLREEVAGIDREREKVIAEPKPQLSTISRTVAEKDVDDAVVVGRRQKLWDARLAGVDGRLSAAQAAIRTLEEQGAELNAVVQKAFDMTATRARGVHAWYERRASVYLRALTLHHAHGSQLQALLRGADTIPTPAWISQPCPWVPKLYTADAAPVSVDTPTE